MFPSLSLLFSRWRRFVYSTKPGLSFEMIYSRELRWRMCRSFLAFFPISTNYFEDGHVPLSAAAGKLNMSKICCRPSCCVFFLYVHFGIQRCHYHPFWMSVLIRCGSWLARRKSVSTKLHMEFECENAPGKKCITTIKYSDHDFNYRKCVFR